MSDKLDINEIFGDYKNFNIDIVKDYMTSLAKKLSNYENFNFPFFNGPDTFRFSEYLNNRELNENSMPVNDVLEYVSPLFQNVPNWKNPGTMINIIPPTNLAALAVSSVANILNPNFAQDTYAGLLISSELEVSKYMSDLIGWDYTKSHGIFTFGGKGTNIYATKTALTVADPDAARRGAKSEYFMVTSASAHPCHYQACEWLGIGSDNCFEIPFNKDGQLDLIFMDEIIRKNLDAGKIFIGYNLNGGTTNELFVDPIYSIYNYNLELVDNYNLNYLPHIHVDGVIGWVYLMFKDYDFSKNELNLNENSINKIKSLSLKVSDFVYADSIGIDFHKTGYCPYSSSMILFKEKTRFYASNLDRMVKFNDLEYGNYNPYETTLELTRPSSGPLTALVSLKTLGKNGFRQLVANLFSATECFRKGLNRNKSFLLLNEQTEGFATLFIALPEKYSYLNINNIKKISKETELEIREYNVNFSQYVLWAGRHGLVNFTFTSSRSYKLPGTEIKLGVLKSYPTSIFLDEKNVEIILKQLFDLVEKFKDCQMENNGFLIDDNMVYKGRK